MVLSDLISGCHAIISGLDGDKNFRKKMLEMGLIINYEVEVIIGGGYGPVFLAIGDTRLAIGHNDAKKILVIKDVTK
jgi:Fe2+ transport system protein FeoA